MPKQLRPKKLKLGEKKKRLGKRRDKRLLILKKHQVRYTADGVILGNSIMVKKSGSEKQYNGMMTEFLKLEKK